MDYCGNHFVQFHKDSATLAKEVSAFIATGLRGSEGVVAIATEEHTRAIIEELFHKGFDAANCQEAGQLVLLDAEATLAAFMSVGIPDWPKFRDTIAPQIAATRDRGFQKIRAYGEMVDILWRKGNSAAAIRLEEYWNDISHIMSFSLLCAYMLDGLDESSYAGPLHEIGRTHSDVISGEDDARLLSAIDAASEDLWGTRLSTFVTLSESRQGEHRLPVGRRTVMWLKRTMPLKVTEVLYHAKRHMGDPNFLTPENKIR